MFRDAYIPEMMSQGEIVPILTLQTQDSVATTTSLEFCTSLVNRFDSTDIDAVFELGCCYSVD